MRWPPLCFLFQSFFSLYLSIMYFILRIHLSTVRLLPNCAFSSSTILVHTLREFLLSSCSKFSFHRFTRYCSSLKGNVSYFAFFRFVPFFVLIWSRSLRDPYIAKFDDPMTDGCQGTKDFLA